MAVNLAQVSQTTCASVSAHKLHQLHKYLVAEPFRSFKFVELVSETEAVQKTLILKVIESEMSWPTRERKNYVSYKAS